MNADAHGLGELRLRQANEAPERGNVLAGFEFALDEAFAQTRGMADSKSASESSAMYYP